MQKRKINSVSYEEEKYIRECFKLALKGESYVSPNPMVGCIIVKDNKIIGKGYHLTYGAAHAEAVAINDALKKGHDLRGASLYVNLEPCAFFGKTPPCTDLIISNKIKNVFIGIKDPNPLVNGRGIKKLLDAGINVKYDILKNESAELNKYFIKSVKHHIPYISLKVAQSLDGKIALKNFSSKWITNEKSREYVKFLRRKYDAVLIGHNTAVKDNPSLLPEKTAEKIPFRIILTDKPGELPQDMKLLSDRYYEKTILISTEINKHSFVKFLKYLHTLNISKILVEGGAFVFSKFLEFNLFDDLYLFTADKILGTGISSFEYFEIFSLKKSVSLKLKYSERFDDNLLQYFTKI